MTSLTLQNESHQRCFIPMQHFKNGLCCKDTLNHAWISSSFSTPSCTRTLNTRLALEIQSYGAVTDSLLLSFLRLQLSLHY
jgi:hypothetical protein